MTTHWMYLVSALLVGAASSADAAFVIKLKNGAEFTTIRYWPAGNQVMFDAYDGVFGIEKSLIAGIARTEKPLPRIDAAQPATVPNSVKTDADAELKRKGDKNQDSLALKRNDNDPVFKKFQALKQQARELDGMLTSELNQFLKDLANLKRAMQLTNKTNEFLTEFGEMHDIADRAEEVLRTRR